MTRYGARPRAFDGYAPAYAAQRGPATVVVPSADPLAAAGRLRRGAVRLLRDRHAGRVDHPLHLRQRHDHPADLEKFQAAKPGREVKLFRAPTGELNARVAADVRSGGLKADVVWACDPLTMRGYRDQQLVGGWLPPEAQDIPEQFRTADDVGVAVLYW